MPKDRKAQALKNQGTVPTQSPLCPTLFRRGLKYVAARNVLPQRCAAQIALVNIAPSKRAYSTRTEVSEFRLFSQIELVQFQIPVPLHCGN